VPRPRATRRRTSGAIPRSLQASGDAGALPGR
jgi:hypothetical protein